jgi:hypothetical protein
MRLSIIGACAAAALTLVVPANGQDNAGIYEFIHAERERAVRTAPVAAALPVIRVTPSRRAERPQPAARVAGPAPGTIESATPVLPQVARPMNQVENPVPALFTDATLRPGDLVAFNDGLRVFRGQVRERHALADFVPARSDKRASASIRRYAASMRVGRNDAWDLAAVPAQTRVATRAPKKEVRTQVSERRPRWVERDVWYTDMRPSRLAWTHWDAPPPRKRARRR